MFRNAFRDRTALSRKPLSSRAPDRRRVCLVLEKLEDRTVPTTYAWNGSTSTDWFTAANWTDVSNPANHAVPAAADSVIINGGNFATVLNGNATVANITMGNGFLTVNANLTDTGTFSMSEGFLAFGSNANQLQIGGDVLRGGGQFLGSVGTVVLNGTAGQNLSDTSIHSMPNLLISNTSTAGVTITNSTLNLATGDASPLTTGDVTINAGSTLTVLPNNFLTADGNIIDNGKVVMTVNTPNNGGGNAPLFASGMLELSSTSAFDLTVGGTLASGNQYVFVFYANGVTGAGSVPVGNIVVHGAGSFFATPNFGPDALTVTLSTTPPPGITDTWTGAVSNDWFTPGNWSANLVPGPNDTAVIKGGNNATVLNANATVAALQVSGGFLIINATLTDTGAFSQDSGFVAFGSDADQLQIAGDVNRAGGVFLGSAGTVVLDGAAQSITDTSGHPFGWNMVVNAGTAATVQPGSVLSVANNLTNNGTVNLSMASPASATPLQVGNNLIEGAGSVFNLSLGNTTAGLTYIFITFGGTETGSATFNPNAGTVHHNAHAITVTT